MTETSEGRTFPRQSVDTLPVDDAGADAIDLERVATHIAQAQARGRYSGTTEPLEYLKLRKCLVPFAGELRATLAGILCFGHSPQAIFPHAVVDIGHYRGNESVSFDVIHLEKGIGGTIFDQLRRVEEYLWRNTHHGMALSERGLERVELHEYPLAVIRELVVNLLAHRDYTIIGSAARVALYLRRIEWISPGGLPPGVTVDNLLEAQTARNPGLLTILYEAGLVEAFGQGLDTVVSVLRSEDMQPPTFRDVGSAFIVTIYGRSMDRESRTGLTLNLTTSQRRIVVLLQERGELTISDIQEALPERSRRMLQDDLRGLVEAGLIDRIGQTRSIRYRLRPPS
jgi:ATP-dependent DNA helicase RecG